MKIITLLLILAFSTVYATRATKEIEKGSQLISFFEERPGTYLTMFYDHNSDKGRISKARNDARDQILARHPYITYTEVDVDDSEFQNVVNLIGLDKVECEHRPSFLVLTQGIGYIAHGEDAITDIVKSLSSKDWYLAHRHQRTAAEVEAEKAAKNGQ
ncbi:unnamed protein product [Moneuplotes crassus]|uniref:Uncharacterized protein n=1 Tax=Euplotes crassus TaxID=5936 RepID=A0AAD1Y130_EUPCR|nr:unnamed protein product [Moneuplotes crassus]